MALVTRIEFMFNILLPKNYIFLLGVRIFFPMYIVQNADELFKKKSSFVFVYNFDFVIKVFAFKLETTSMYI